MKKEQFVFFRKKLGKTQAQMAQLLGVSLKAIHSYEQGWRSIPAHVERQLLFLVSRIGKGESFQKQCWIIKNCPADHKTKCPAWEFKAGKLCWFINGTICNGVAQKTWGEKIRICETCEVMVSLFEL